MILEVVKGLLFFGVIRTTFSDTRSLGSWCIKGNDESLTRVYSSILLMRHDMSDLESLIPIRIILEGRSLRLMVRSFPVIQNVHH